MSTKESKRDDKSQPVKKKKSRMPVEEPLIHNEGDNPTRFRFVYQSSKSNF